MPNVYGHSDLEHVLVPVKCVGALQHQTERKNNKKAMIVTSPLTGLAVLNVRLN